MTGKNDEMRPVSCHSRLGARAGIIYHRTYTGIYDPRNKPRNPFPGPGADPPLIPSPVAFSLLPLVLASYMRLPVRAFERFCLTRLGKAAPCGGGGSQEIQVLDVKLWAYLTGLRAGWPGIPCANGQDRRQRLPYAILELHLPTPRHSGSLPLTHSSLTPG